MTNVINMPERNPTEIDTRWTRLGEALTRADRGREDWIEGMTVAAVEAHALRQQYKNDAAFGAAWDERFCHMTKPLNAVDRAALIQIGASEDAARRLFSTTERASLQHMVRSGELDDARQKLGLLEAPKRKTKPKAKPKPKAPEPEPQPQPAKPEPLPTHAFKFPQDPAPVQSKPQVKVEPRPRPKAPEPPPQPKPGVAETPQVPDPEDEEMDDTDADAPVDDDIDALLARDLPPIHTDDPDLLAKYETMKDRHKVIYAEIDATGNAGITKDDLTANLNAKVAAVLPLNGHNWATNKHMDQFLGAIFTRDLIIPIRGRIYAVMGQIDPPVRKLDLSETAQQKLDRAIKQHQKKLDDAHREKVMTENREWLAEHLLPDLMAEIKTLKSLLFATKGWMTKDQFNAILKLVHPKAEQVDGKYLHELLTQHRVVLVKGEAEYKAKTLPDTLERVYDRKPKKPKGQA